MSRDPLGEEGGLNLYGHADNNPINLIDGLGLDPIALPDGRIIEGDNLPPEVLAELQILLNKGAITAGQMGIALALGSSPFATIPKTPGQIGRGPKGVKEITTILSNLQLRINANRKARGLPPKRNLRDLGRKLSKGRNAFRYVSIALNSYALTSFAACKCECKDESRGKISTK